MLENYKCGGGFEGDDGLANEIKVKCVWWLVGAPVCNLGLG